MKAGVISQQLMQSLQLEVCTTKILSVFNKWWTSTSAEAHSSLHSTLQYSNFKQGESLSLQIFKIFFKRYEMITYNNNSAVLSWNNPKLDRKLFLSEIINSVFVIIHRNRSWFCSPERNGCCRIAAGFLFFHTAPQVEFHSFVCGKSMKHMKPKLSAWLIEVVD